MRGFWQGGAVLSGEIAGVGNCSFARGGIRVAGTEILGSARWNRRV